MAQTHDHVHRGPASLPVSLVRFSAAQRLAIAFVLAALLWGAVVWALT
jgi:hypothetical protein